MYLPDGEPDGLRHVTKTGWIGCGLVVPRSLLSKAKIRDEFDRPGVYVLTGPSESGDLPTVYVGEGSPVRSRLESHLNAKDFWTMCVFFTANDGSLNKAHIQYLESSLIGLAVRTKRCILENTQSPSSPVLSESEQADSENFLEDMLSILPLVGVSVFEEPSSFQSSRSDTPAKLYIAAKGIKASGYESNAGFIVTAGSQAVCNELVVTSCSEKVVSLRNQLIDSGVLTNEQTGLRFTQDFEFSSPSFASSFVRGDSSNGRYEWKSSAGVRLSEIQDAASDKEI